jgi:hypothetical protein
MMQMQASRFWTLIISTALLFLCLPAGASPSESISVGADKIQSSVQQYFYGYRTIPLTSLFSAEVRDLPIRSVVVRLRGAGGRPYFGLFLDGHVVGEGWQLLSYGSEDYTFTLPATASLAQNLLEIHVGRGRVFIESVLLEP